MKEKLGEYFYSIKAETGELKKGVQESKGLLKKVGVGAVAMAGAVAAAVVAIWRKIKAFVKDTIDKWIAQQKAVMGLEKAIEAQGQSVTLLSHRYRQMASELQKLTGVGDETILSLITQATQLGITSDKMEQVIKTVLDMNASGLEMNTVLRGISQLMEGNVGLLTRYVPALRKMKDEGASVDEMLNHLSATFAGQAETAEKASGYMNRLHSAVGDVKEIIGRDIMDKLTPIIKGMAEQAEKTAKALEMARKSIFELGEEKAIEMYAGLSIEELQEKQKILEKELATQEKMELSLIEQKNLLEEQLKTLPLNTKEHGKVGKEIKKVTAELKIQTDRYKFVAVILNTVNELLDEQISKQKELNKEKKELVPILDNIEIKLKAGYTVTYENLKTLQAWVDEWARILKKYENYNSLTVEQFELVKGATEGLERAEEIYKKLYELSKGVTEETEKSTEEMEEMTKFSQDVSTNWEEVQDILGNAISEVERWVNEFGEGNEELNKLVGYLRNIEGIIESLAFGDVVGGIVGIVFTIVKGIRDIIAGQTDEYTEQERVIDEILEKVSIYEERVKGIQSAINSINSLYDDEELRLKAINRLLEAQADEAMKILDTARKKLLEIFRKAYVPGAEETVFRQSLYKQIIDILEASGSGLIENIADLQEVIMQAPYGWREDVQALFDQLIESNEELAGLFEQIGMNAEMLARLPFETAMNELKAEEGYLREIGEDVTENLKEQIETLENMLTIIDDEVERYEVMTEIARLRNELETDTLGTMKEQLMVAGKFLDVQNVVNQRILEQGLRQAGLSGLALNEALQGMGVVGRGVGDVITTSTVGTIINNNYYDSGMAEPNIDM